MKINSITLIITVLMINLTFGQTDNTQKSTSNSDNTEKEIIENPIDYIKKETIGGKLDFKKLYIGYGEENAEYKVYLYSVSTWAYAVKDLGIENRRDIIKLWEEIHKRKMTKDEKKAIDLGLKEE